MTNLFDLTGSRAIVTGGTRGLGHGMAEGLMEAGASVVIFGSNDKVEQVAADFRAKGYSCQGVKANLASAEERKAGFEKAVALLGGLDIIINAAGIQRRYPSPDFPLEDWNDVIEVNLTAPFDLSQMAAREFLKKEQPYGKIVNIASMLSFFGGFTVPAYAASKGGVAQFSKALCNELAGKGITVNCIAPGYMDIISLHLHANAETNGMICKETLALMKPTAILINVSRGPLVKDEDLLDALRGHRILAAGLDTHNHEPLGAQSPFCQLDNVVLTDHTAYSTAEGVTELKTKAAQNVVDVLEGRTPRYPVNHL